MVDLVTLTSSTILENFKCIVCKNYLSYFPIFLCFNNKSVCGRCTIPDGLISCENEPFEEICQHFKFPCRFKNEGCPEELVPKDIPKHEDKCPFRVVECVINKPEKCRWQGSLSDLLRHCDKQHSDLILKNHEFEMDPTDVEERDNLVKFEDTFLTFRRKYDPKTAKLTFGLCFLKYESFEIFLCQLSVKNDKTTVTFDFEPAEADLTFNEVSLKHFYSHDKPDTFLMKLKLPESKHVNTVQQNELNIELLEFLKCQTCSLIIKPPVYHCKGDISPVCSSCLFQHNSSCKYCYSYSTSGGAVLGNSKFKNILSFRVEYPCKYNNNGCTFSSNNETLEEHQISCEYENIDCPLSNSNKKCTWKGHRKDLKSHIRDDHIDCIHTSSEITYELHSEGKINMSFMKFSRHLFLLSYDCEVKGEYYKWSLQKIGDFDLKYYWFEVEIFGDVPPLRYLVATRCSTLRNNNDIFKENVCYIRKDQVRCLKTDKGGNLKFRVRIFEI